jgi:hypothetical protein
MRTALVVVMLLALVGTASAECSWVLWMEVHAWGRAASGEAENKWEIVEVYDSRSSCSVQRKQEVIRVAASVKEQAETKNPFLPKSTYKVTEDAVVTQYFSKASEVPTGGATIRYRCLPDTIDPRGPKGK